jgi:hypothetical protein
MDVRIKTQAGAAGKNSSPLIAPKSGRVLKKRRGLLVVSTGGKKFNAAEAVRIAREERS